MRAATRVSIRLIVLSILASGIVLLATWLQTDRAAAQDAASVRGYIVPTANNPDVEQATTCAAAFADNDQSDSQPQSPAGTAQNAVTLAGCIYDTVPFGGPSSYDGPAAFEVTSGPGGLLCGQGIQQNQVCALSGINYQPGAEYRVSVNNQAGQDVTGTTTVKFCADDPPAEGKCGIEDEQTTSYTIVWGPAQGGPGPGQGPGTAAATCKGKPATIIGTNGNDVLKGTPGKDVIVGLAGNDKLSGLAGNDLICGGAGKDTLKGGSGNDFLSGQKGNDKLYGQKGNDKLSGKKGKDLCVGGPGKDKAKGCEKTKSI